MRLQVLARQPGGVLANLPICARTSYCATMYHGRNYHYASSQERTIRATTKQNHWATQNLKNFEQNFISYQELTKVKCGYTDSRCTIEDRTTYIDHEAYGLLGGVTVEIPRIAGFPYMPRIEGHSPYSGVSLSPPFSYNNI